MTRTLQLKFDPNQDYQLQAIDSVVKLFEGLPQRTVAFDLSGDIVPNLPPYESLHGSWLLDNLLAVQKANHIENGQATLLPQLQMDSGMVLGDIGSESHAYPHFTIEMETGTGKTYVYLRTIYELRRRYGFTKFIVVVPSIAIYEGVIKNFEITRAHFRALYSNEVVNLIKYDGSQISQLRSFATSTLTEVMVITLDSFNKATNVIYRASEKLPGDRKPCQFIQETRPILILDEPQNMESDRAKEALRALHPLFALRYSATHRSSPNLVYRLTPFEAYRRNLVKKIQVYGVTERENFNQPFLALQSISIDGGIKAHVKTYVQERGQMREQTITLKHGDDLHTKTNRDEHRAGYRVVEIDAALGFVEWENGLKLFLNETIGPSRPEIFRVQIQRTIEQHMELQERLKDQDIKVLSLFFIDRVANYVDRSGIIRMLFDQEFEKLKTRYPTFENLRPEQVREAYFARKKSRSGDEEAIDTSSRNAEEREAERAAFELIMRQKEQLLSFDEPVCFIFAHSALKEGWDNPNVFQICTLNQTVSEIKKRQEIGRGLRLSVDQHGNRIFDDDINVLTVVANESYQSYAANLQREYVADGDAAPPAPTDAKKRDAKRNDAIFRRSQDFKDFWQKLLTRVSYHVDIDTPALTEVCIERLNAQAFPLPLVIVEKGDFVVTRLTLTLESVSRDRAKIAIDIVDTDNNQSNVTRQFNLGDDLSEKLPEDRLRGFKIVEIRAGDQPCVIFGNNKRLDQRAPYTFSTETGQKPRERASLLPTSAYPVFNLIDRAARETNLTRPTINAIFKGMRPDKKRMILKNPEGFAGVFIAELRNALANHLTERIQFAVEDGTLPYDLEELFPGSKKFPQKELLEAGDRGLYDLVQKDSNEEADFIEQLKHHEPLVFFFKFPPSFKVDLPKIIGNYNPDWGIARRESNGEFSIHVDKLVRETKGTTDIEKLQWAHEKRKIRCAQKYFRAIGIDYRSVTSKTVNWWEPAPEQDLLLT